MFLKKDSEITQPLRKALADYYETKQHAARARTYIETATVERDALLKGTSYDSPELGKLAESDMRIGLAKTKEIELVKKLEELTQVVDQKHYQLGYYLNGVINEAIEAILVTIDKQLEPMLPGDEDSIVLLRRRLAETIRPNSRNYSDLVFSSWRASCSVREGTEIEGAEKCLEEAEAFLVALQKHAKAMGSNAPKLSVGQLEKIKAPVAAEPFVAEPFAERSVSPVWARQEAARAGLKSNQAD